MINLCIRKIYYYKFAKHRRMQIPISKKVRKDVESESACVFKKGFSIHYLQWKSLISTFVVRCLASIIPLVSISEISSLYLASEAEQAGLSLTWSQSPKTGFLVTKLR